MKRFSIIILLIAFLSSCSKTPGIQDTNIIYYFPGTHSYSFLPGECLNSSELVFEEAYDASYNGSGVMRFFFSFDMDCQWEPLHGPYSGWLKPNESVFDSFGDKKDFVKQEYYKFYNSLSFLNDGNVTTIYYKEGIHLILHDNFANYSAGTDLGDLVFFPEDKYPAIASDVPGIENVDGMRQLHKRFMFLVPCDVFSINLAGSYHFTFTMPVKIGQYLNYLEDRNTDPDTTVQFKDEVLTCKFTVEFVH
ncbi:MAG: hypothetical protein IKX71_01475 [Bacteroidales bacterium]|nr:hypothetical protein [Bacteroidales bacterium]